MVFRGFDREPQMPPTPRRGQADTSLASAHTHLVRPGPSDWTRRGSNRARVADRTLHPTAHPDHVVEHAIQPFGCHRLGRCSQNQLPLVGPGSEFTA